MAAPAKSPAFDIKPTEASLMESEGMTDERK